MDLNIVRKYFTPDTILDIGANVGQFHTLAQQTFPYSAIFSIEANPLCEPALKAITNNYYIGLLGEESREYTFYGRKNDATASGNSVYRELTPFYDDELITVEKMTAVRLDDLFEDDGRFDLIKIDTQGSELDILRGGPKLASLARGILLEVSLVAYNDGSPLKPEIDSYMESIGFRGAEVIGVGHHPQTHEIIQHDILYVK